MKIVGERKRRRLAHADDSHVLRADNALTWRSGSLIFKEIAAKKPALPPPTTMMRWIIGFLRREGVPVEFAQATTDEGLRAAMLPRDIASARCSTFTAGRCPSGASR